MCQTVMNFLTTMNFLAENLPEISREILPDMIGTHSSVGVTPIFDVIGYERGIYYDFETNRIHKTSSWDSTVGVPEANVDISRSFTWFHHDNEIDSLRAVEGNSWEYDIGGSAWIAGGNITYQFNTQNAPMDDITTIIFSGSVGPDGLPVDFHTGGSSTWIRNTESFDNNTEMAQAIVQHRMSAGEGGSVHSIFGLRQFAETAALSMYAFIK